MKRITSVEGLAPAVGPYSLAVIHGDTVYTAGQIGQTAEAILVKGGIEAETHQVMENLHKILKAAGVDFNDVIKTTIYLTSVSDFSTMNEVYAHYFTNSDYPVRETTITSLPLGAHVEISMVAVLASQQ